MMAESKCNVLLALTGSVAAIKAEKLVESFSKFANVKVVYTSAALHFFNKEELLSKVEVFGDDDEYSIWHRIGDPVLHIDLRTWADIFVVAPCSANTLAKLAHGLCDNLVTCIARAWDQNKPFYIAPAMNTTMWEHKLTNEHITQISNYVRIISPISKKLACGVSGMGAMAEATDIGDRVRNDLITTEC